MIWPNTLVFNAQWFFYGSHLASVPKRFQDKLQSGSRCFRLYLDIFRGWSFLSNSDIQRTSAVLLWLHLDVPTLCDKTAKVIRNKQRETIYMLPAPESKLFQKKSKSSSKKSCLSFRIWSLSRLAKEVWSSVLVGKSEHECIHIICKFGIFGFITTLSLRQRSG